MNQIWKDKLNDLSLDTGLPVEEMLKEAVFDSVAPGICMNESCSYTAYYEPDQQEGWCEACGTTTVTSCLILAGIY